MRSAMKAMWVLLVVCLAGCGGKAHEVLTDVIPEVVPTVDTVDVVAEVEAACVPECEGKECGEDGCGAQCGTCEDGQYCENHRCQWLMCLPGGEPWCEGNKQWACDDNGWHDYVLEDCSLVGQVCHEGECCAPTCQDEDGISFECGDDGCGGDCGPCPEGEECNDGGCVVPCGEGGPCCVPCAMHSDCDDLFTAEELGACHVPKCQFSLDCEDWQCGLGQNGDPLCCDSVQDCWPLSCHDVDCVDNKCTYEKMPGYCVDPQILYSEDFDDLEDGAQPDLSDLEVSDDNPLDDVVWTAQEDPCGEGKALYLGDPNCLTYFNGVMDDCQPVDAVPCQDDVDCIDGCTCETTPNGEFCQCPPATPLEFSATSPVISFPADSFAAVYFSLRTDLEPMLPDFPPSDALRLHVERILDSQDLVTEEVEIFLAPQSTYGDCVAYVADLTSFVPTTGCPGTPPPQICGHPDIRLIWRFKTLDGVENHHPGVWLDDIRVQTFYIDCSSSSQCDDADPCTVDTCLEPVFGISDGLCDHQALPNCPP